MVKLYELVIILTEGMVSTGEAKLRKTANLQSNGLIQKRKLLRIGY